MNRNTRNKTAFTVTAALATVMLAGTAVAQQQRQQQQRDQQQQQQERRMQQTEEQAQRALAAHALSDNIIGKDVVDPRGESLGSIDDLVIDLRKGEASFAVLAFGGTLGFNRDKVAVPMRAFTWDNREERFVLNTTRERLEAAPDFDSDDLDKISEEGWIDRTMRAFGIERGDDRNADDRRNTQQERQMRDRQRQDQQRRDRDDYRDRSSADDEEKHKPFAMGSDLDSIKIVTRDEEELGSIDQIVVDRNSGRVAFATLNHGGVLGIGADTVIFPWEALERTDDKKFKVSINKNRLENAPEFDDEDKLRDAAFVQSVYRFYQVRPDQRRDADQRRDQRRDREERRQQGG
ncbi:MAG: PRC-barrel domain-containing protein [Phycisphaerales bacterium]|nr:PRC-barrel domain-containing protein [Phycisphaerales bacterium]